MVQRIIILLRIMEAEQDKINFGKSLKLVIACNEKSYVAGIGNRASIFNT